MNINITKVKIIVTILEGMVGDVRKAICEIGVGTIGNYTYCSTLAKTVGTFKPNENANLYIGTFGKLEFVQEDKLEVVCNINDVKKVVTKLREVHPYEEVAIDIVPLLDESIFLEL